MSVLSVTESLGERWWFRFFDLEVELRADDPVYVALFVQMYGRFQSPSPSTSPLTIRIITKPDAGEDPRFILGAQTIPLNEPYLLTEGYIYELILDAVLRQIRSHLLIHAGVVAQDEAAILVAADSGHGKTTLILELVQRGFQFLSDEFAPLSREDGLVHPFPRSLRVRPGSLEMTGFAGAAAQASPWLGKLLLDVEALRPGSLGTAAPVRQVIILQNPDVDPAQVGAGEVRELGIMVDRLPAAFLAAVGEIEGVTAVDTAIDRGRPLLRLFAAERTAVLTAVEALAARHNILILDVIKRRTPWPTFDQPARLEPIPKSKAAMELLRRFEAGHKSALLQEEFGGSTSRLFMSVAATISKAKCYNLYVGPLAEMGDLVSDLTIDKDIPQ